MADELFGFSDEDNNIDTVKPAMPDEDELGAVAQLFKMLGDTTRIRILYALSLREMCVQDISELLDISQSAVSHQLRLLRTSKLVKNKKNGKQVFYSLAGPHIEAMIKEGHRQLSL